MLKQITLNNWKSFGDAALYIDPLTVLIGTNASGKSNVLDALQLLNRMASGLGIKSVLDGDANITGVRGGMEWACLDRAKCLSLSVVAGSACEDNIEYHYQIDIQLKDTQATIVAESLQRIKYRARTRKNPGRIYLFRTDPATDGDPHLVARLYNGHQGTKATLSNTTALLFQLSLQKNRSEIDEGIQQLIGDLQKVFILDPIPSHMRGYTPLAEQLEPDAANIAGVLAALDEAEQQRIEATLKHYVQHLPEKDITRIYAETVGKFARDAMLYCDEDWGDNNPHTIDARGMSDGTLRFLGVLVALLTRPEHSMLIVEEVDNGLHPSRSELLITMLKELGAQRSIDILVTTHNPTLLDTMGPAMVPFITVAHRNAATGQSELTLLEEISELPKLLASGPVGRLSAQGRIERTLQGES